MVWFAVVFNSFHLTVIKMFGIEAPQIVFQQKLGIELHNKRMLGLLTEHMFEGKNNFYQGFLVVISCSVLERWETLKK